MSETDTTTMPSAARGSSGGEEAASAVAEFRSGFPVVLTAALGSAFGVSGLAVYPLPYFMPALEQEFGWNRSAVGFVATFVTFSVFLVAPWVGRLCDEMGVHRVTPISIVLLSLGFVLMTQVGGSVWTLYGAACLLAILGCGTIYICYARAINTWFDAGRGLALGMMAAGTGISAFVIPLILPPIIARFGWQAGFLTLAALVLSVLPLAMAFIRERQRPVTAGARPNVGLSIGKILRNYRFWFMAAGGLLVTTAVSGTSLHFVPMFTDLGGERRDIEQTAALYGLSLIIGRLVAGFLLDRAPGTLVAFILFLIPAIATLSPGLFGWQVAAFYAVAVGIAMAVETDLVAYLSSRYFGLKSFSQAYGWLYAVGALGFAAGPLFAGWAYNQFGNYEVARIVWCAMFLSGALLFGTLGRYPTLQELEQKEASK